MKPGITLYFVRHGQTEWNLLRRIQGQIDAPLNDTGRGQAARNGQTLKSLGLSLESMPFVASPLSRCRETMEIIRENAGLPHDGYTTDDRLKEIHFGHWQGQHWPEVATADPEGYAEREKDHYRWRPRDGESYHDLTMRTVAWLDEIDRDTICVAHGGVSRALRGHILKLDPAEVPELPVPQDKILILRTGEMEWV